MAGSRLLKKILSDFLFGFYLLNFVLKHATNHTQNRCASADKINKNSAKIETFRYLRTKNKAEFYSESEKY